MNYYKYVEEGIVMYFDNDDGCMYRQLTFDDDNQLISASSICTPSDVPQLGDYAEPLEDDDEEAKEYYEAMGMFRISQEEFDSLWNTHLERHRPQWEAAKAKYALGTPVTGAMLIFFPQGVLVDLGFNAIGVANYGECQASAQPEWMYPKHKVRAVVTGYDEVNQWIKLREPQVLRESI